MKRMWEKVKETWREFWFVYEDEEDGANAVFRQYIQNGLVLSLEHGVAHLVDQARHTFLSQELDRALCLGGRIVGDAHIQRLAAAHGVGQGVRRFFQRCVGIGAVVVKNVYIF